MASGGGVAEWPLRIILIATGIYCANANQNSNSADTGLESIVAINGVEGSSFANPFTRNFKATAMPQLNGS